MAFGPGVFEFLEVGFILDGVTLANTMYLYEWDWAGAQREFERGIELAPNYALGRQWYANYLQVLGHSSEGIDEQSRAVAFDPLSLILNANLWRAYLFANRLDEAIQQCRKTQDLDPRFWIASGWLRDALEHKGLDQESAEELERQLRANGDPKSEVEAEQIFARDGIAGLNRWGSEETLERARNEYVALLDLIPIYLALGNRQKVLELLEQAYQDHDYVLVFYEMNRLDPAMLPLRSDPRYVSIRRKMTLPQ
jgi:tetratricopeptide (TPR) repeat protein